MLTLHNLKFACGREAAVREGVPWRHPSEPIRRGERQMWQTESDPCGRKAANLGSVSSRNAVLLVGPFHPNPHLAGLENLYLLNERAIHNGGTMNPHEAIWLQLFVESRDRLVRRLRPRGGSNEHVPATGFDRNHLAGFH